MINPQKLTQELITAGITTHGNCNSRGVVWDDENNEIQDRPDVAAIIAAHDPTPILPTSQIFDLPIVTPSVTAGDYFVQSPKPKADHLQAHAEAVAESKKANKSLALMVLDMVVYIEELEKRVKALEKK